jgi:predicted DCC family thiol-disulfide oxidoreductase YuxK
MNQHAPYSYRTDPAVPAFPDDKPVIVFDGHCAMCSAWARFVIRHDPGGRFRLLPAQTPLGRAIYLHYGLDPVDYETNILIESGRVYVKSESTLRMLRGLGLPWSLAAATELVPRRLLDWAYDIAAKNRFRVFGRTQACYRGPSGGDATADRFLS